MTAYQAELAALSLPEFGLPRVEPAIPAVVYRERMTAFRQRLKPEVLPFRISQPICRRSGWRLSKRCAW